jgi:hypothetical protein
MGQVADDDCELGGGLDAAKIPKLCDKEDERIGY